MFMYGFLTGFSSPGSIFAEKVTHSLFPVLSPFSKYRKYVNFSEKMDSGELKPARKPYINIGLTLPMK